MGDALEITRRQILDPVGLDHHELSKVLGRIMGYAVDDAVLYFQSVRT